MSLQEKNFHVTTKSLAAEACAFRVIPKNATNSILDALLRHEGINTEVMLLHDIRNHPSILKAAPFHFTFAFARNPYNRLVSCYKEKISNRDIVYKPFRKLGFRKEMSFTDFIYHLSHVGIDKDIHTKAQVDFLLSPEGALRTDFLGRIESIDSDWKRIQAITDLPALRHLYKSNEERYTMDHYTHKTAGLARELYAQDLRFLGYV